MFIKSIILFLIQVATTITSVLPDHTQLFFPDNHGIAIVFRGVSTIDLFVDVNVVIVSILIILVYSGAKLLYGAYRVVLGLIPMLK